jgi:hypothetical protein
MNYLNMITKKIGVFVSDTHFDLLLEGLRIKGVDIQKIKIGDSIEDFSSIIIDFSYPLEMAYKLLDKIDTDSQLCNINIFALISSQDEIDKITRAQNTRICDYIDIHSSVEELRKKLNEGLSPEGQPKKQFENINVNIAIKGVMTHISESGALFSSPILFNRDERIKITSDLLVEICKSNLPIFKVSKIFPSPNHAFITEMDFLNLSDQSRTSLRRAIIGWSLK